MIVVFSPVVESDGKLHHDVEVDCKVVGAIHPTTKGYGYFHTGHNLVLHEDKDFLEVTSKVTAWLVSMMAPKLEEMVFIPKAPAPEKKQPSWMGWFKNSGR